MTAKYEPELKDILHRVWQRDATDMCLDIDDYINQMFEGINTNYEKLSDEIDVGIKNGASLQLQLSLFERLLSL